MCDLLGVMSQTARKDKQEAQVLFASTLTCVAALESEGTVMNQTGGPAFFRGFFSRETKTLKSEKTSTTSLKNSQKHRAERAQFFFWDLFGPIFSR